MTLDELNLLTIIDISPDQQIRKAGHQLAEKIQQTEKQLTIVQEECTKLLLENRELKERIKELERMKKL